MIPMRERQTQWFFCWAMFLCGAAFLIASRTVPSAMSIKQFGALAYDIPAETWAMGYMSASALSAYGIHINGRWRWSAVFRIAGYVALLSMFCVLIWSAWSAPYGMQTVVFGGLFFVPVIVWFLRINLSDFGARWRNGTR